MYFLLSQVPQGERARAHLQPPRYKVVAGLRGFVRRAAVPGGADRVAGKHRRRERRGRAEGDHQEAEGGAGGGTGGEAEQCGIRDDYDVVVFVVFVGCDEILIILQVPIDNETTRGVRLCSDVLTV